LQYRLLARDAEGRPRRSVRFGADLEATSVECP
jgi:hypothetical protein